MNWNVKKIGPTVILSIVAFNTMLNADPYKMREKDRNPPMRCDRPSICGPDMGMGVTPPARPFTDDACCCDSGEFSIEVAGFYWQAAEDGLEYGIESHVIAPLTPGSSGNANFLVDASFNTPDFKWKPGFKVGLGYNTTHDGWDLDLIWTHFNGRGKSSINDQSNANITFIPLWSAFSSPIGTGPGGLVLWATQATASWRVDLNMVDFELGREFWLSKMMTIRPHMGFRVAQVNQRYELDYFGGVFSAFTPEVNDIVKMKNHFTGGGVRGGIDLVWNFGCCNPCSGNWGLFGNMALALVYGKFKVKQGEFIRTSVSPASTSPVIGTNDHFRSLRGIIDLAFGLQWESLFNDSNSGMLLQLAWEFHQFFNQNQLSKITRIRDLSLVGHGENVYVQTRGDLSTQGLTLTTKFTF